MLELPDDETIPTFRVDYQEGHVKQEQSRIDLIKDNSDPNVEESSGDDASLVV